MRLASKIFLAAVLALLLPLGTAAWSLVAMNRLVAVNRDIITHTAPALELEVAARESLVRLVRIEQRASVFRDPEYRDLWKARRMAVDAELGRLPALLTTRQERSWERKAAGAFTTYTELVEALPPHNPQAKSVRQRDVHVSAARIERSLWHLSEATRAALTSAQTRAAVVERRTWRAVATALPASVGVALTGAALLALRMTRTLRRLSAATTAVAQGAFEKPLAVRTRDEIGELARAFDHMAERLGEADRLKEELFSHISHELRTPLTAVREATHLLRERVPGPLEPKQARLVEIIGESTERVLRLVNQILELSRLRAGLVALERVPVDVSRLVAQALEQVRPQAEARGVTLHGAAAVPAVVQGDQERLLQVLLNLLGNAIKFTTAGGVVRVRLEPSATHVGVDVEDTGVGIPAAALSRIFEPYWQVNGARGGSGLGLAIVKGIVEAHGGRIDVTSREGHGSRFTVVLPRTGAPV